MYQDDDGTFYDVILSHVPFSVVFSLFRRKQLYTFLTKGRRQWEWRCRAKLAVRGTSMDPQIGLFEEGSHFVVDIPSCRAHHPSINATIKLVKEAIQELGIQPYNEDLHLGELHYVQVRYKCHWSGMPGMRIPSKLTV
jgi:tRNA/tmRNA/rRNA uracil-C5-methylase (TrmA/RlmC/RlmD family)